MKFFRREFPCKLFVLSPGLISIFCDNMDSNEDPGGEVDHIRRQSRSPSLRSLVRKRRLWDNPFQGEI